MDAIEHNDKIADQIIGELRRSPLIVADVASHCGGVYFEAGYGSGRGVPVVWCCLDDDLKAAHFDTRQ